jgi:nucleoside-diphosphate-sugar epimerase
VARVLIVGCGCRGRALAAELTGAGHAVRGTTRDPERLADIEASGGEGVVADPDRLGTLMPHLAGVSAVCWLMASVDSGAAPELHGPRLGTLLERLVDTPVRGFVYEGAGTVSGRVLEGGARAVREAAEVWHMPVAVTTTAPAEHRAWLAELRSAVGEVLYEGC